MRAQLKVVVLVALVLVVTLSAIVWKTQSLLTEDKMNFVVDSSMKQLAPLKRLVSEKLETEKNDLIRFATLRESQGAGRSTSFGGFDAIALVEMNASSSQWMPTWIEKGPGLRAEKWSAGYDLTLLKSLPYQKVKDGSSLWVRLSDPQGAPVYAVLNSVEVQSSAATAPSLAGALPERTGGVITTPGAVRRAVIVGFATDNPLAIVTEDYIGSTNSVYIVDDRGYVASHVKNTFLGSSFAEDSLTQEITKTNKLADTRETTNMDGQKVMGHFERIDRTNLTAVIDTPLTAVTGLSQAFVRTVVWVGGLLTVLSLLAAAILGGTLVPESRSEIRSARDSIPDSESAHFVAPTRVLPVEVPRAQLAAETAAETAMPNSDRLQNERRNAFDAFNSSLAARLREPLLAILGQAQLVRSKATDPELLSHTESIEREARAAKDAIERFQVIEEASTLGAFNETCDLEKVVLAAIAEKAIEIEGSQITLEQNLSHVPRVRGRAADIESMIVHVLDNSIEAMRDRSTKKMTIQLSWLGDRVRFLISDSGIGMSRDVQQRAFEPFYKGFETPRRMGLGLAFVQTTAKRIGARYELESSPGEGTLMTFEFPVEAEAKKAFEAATAAPSLEQINQTIDAFTLNGRKPIEPRPPVEMAAEAGGGDDGFRVTIRRPKPRG